MIISFLLVGLEVELNGDNENGNLFGMENNDCVSNNRLITFRLNALTVQQLDK